MRQIVGYAAVHYLRRVFWRGDALELGGSSLRDRSGLEVLNDGVNPIVAFRFLWWTVLLVLLKERTASHPRGQRRPARPRRSASLISHCVL